MSQDQNNKEITIRDQMKKFLIKGFYGFNTILAIGLGRRLGIFDYLDEKAKKITVRDNQGSSRKAFSKEQKLLSELLCAFDIKGVNALVILERKGKHMDVMTNGISGCALLAFITDLFSKNPELYKASEEILNDMERAMEEVDSNPTIH